MAALIDKLDHETARAICGRRNNKPDALIEILHEVQSEEGYLSDEALRTIADALNISRAEIHGVVSFYHDFRRSAPTGKIIKLCRAEACQAVGSEELAAYAEKTLSMKSADTPSDGGVALEAVYCLGNCALGPAALVDDKLYGRLTSERFDALVKKLENAERR